jgi:hypothetical protein
MWLASAAVSTVSADTVKSKFGPDAVPLPQAVDYLRQHEAPDYWALSVYYVPQATSSACSVASIAMVINALRGLRRRWSLRLRCWKSSAMTCGASKPSKMAPA